ncbi:hypothetical protein ACHAWF_015921, partial [Thalassiosira exigua]
DTLYIIPLSMPNQTPLPLCGMFAYFEGANFGGDSNNIKSSSTEESKEVGEDAMPAAKEVLGDAMAAAIAASIARTHTSKSTESDGVASLDELKKKVLETKQLEERLTK